MKKIFIAFWGVLGVVVLSSCGIKDVENNDEMLSSYDYGYEEIQNVEDVEENEVLSSGENVKTVNNIYFSPDYTGVTMTFDPPRKCEMDETTRGRARSHSDENFVILNQYYAKDSDTVYRCIGFEGVNVYNVEGADAPSFEVIEENIAKDKNTVYQQYRAINGADPDSFEIIKSYNGHPVWMRDKNFVYWYSAGDGATKIKELDLNSFEIINSVFIKDSYSVFADGHKIEGADPDSFYVKYPRSSYGYDKNNVYSWYQILSGETPESFKEQEPPF